jgi:vacuolar-type H+-ATPase subunit H
VGADDDEVPASERQSPDASHDDDASRARRGAPGHSEGHAEGQAELAAQLPRPDGAVAPVEPRFRPRALVRLQSMAGNQAVSRLLDRPHLPKSIQPPRGSEPSAPAVQRAPPNQSVKPPPEPNQSVQPPPAKVRNNGITYQGETIYPEQDKSKAILKKLLPQKGASITSSWGNSMVKADAVQKASWQVVADDDYIARCQSSMDAAVKEFDEENRIFMEKFETQAGNLTDELLINAKQQIEKEQQKLGMTSKTEKDLDTGTTTTYSASNKGYLNEAKKSAGVLAELRSTADYRAGVFKEAQKRFQQTAAALPSNVDPNNPLGVNTPGGKGPAIPPEHEAARLSWQEAQEAFAKKAKDETSKYPLLAPLVAGGEETIERLREFSKESTEWSAQNLGEQFAKKLENIQTVHDELGGRFSIWKQPTIISMMHKQMQSDAGQQKMVSDKVGDVKAKDEDSKKMYAAVALGLGLLAAIPTGGTSLLAGVAFTAAASGAALSAYTAYQETQDFLLQSAAADTSLDRAFQISTDEPSLLPLAIDIAAAILDLGAAKAAFTTLKEAIAVARAAKSVEKLPSVITALHEAKISPGKQGQVIAEIFPEGGNIEEALKAIKAGFESLNPTTKGDILLAETMTSVATKAMEGGHVIPFPASRAAAEDVLTKALTGRDLKGKPVKEWVTALVEEAFNPTKEASLGGFYEENLKLIFIRGNVSKEVAASVLVHETVHFGQDAKNMLDTMKTFEKELQAFKAQQSFLKMLPSEVKLPQVYAEIRAMTDTELKQYVKQGYKTKMTNVDLDEIEGKIFGMFFAAGKAM